MSPDELIEVVSKMTGDEWEFRRACNYVGFAIFPKNTLPSLVSVERPVGRAPTINIETFNFPGDTEANAAGLVALRNHAVPIIQALQAELAQAKRNYGKFASALLTMILDEIEAEKGPLGADWLIDELHDDLERIAARLSKAKPTTIATAIRAGE